MYLVSKYLEIFLLSYYWFLLWLNTYFSMIAILLKLRGFILWPEYDLFLYVFYKSLKIMCILLPLVGVFHKYRLDPICLWCYLILYLSFFLSSCFIICNKLLKSLIKMGICFSLSILSAFI